MRPLGISPSLLTLLATIVSPSCTSSGTETDNPIGPEGIEIRRSSLDYLTGVDVPAADSDALRSGARAFSLELYDQVANRAGAEDNLCLGVNSIFNVLTMTSAGSRNTTETEFTTILQHNLTQESLHPAMNRLAQDLRAGLSNGAIRYRALNSIWLAKDHEVATPFLDVLSQHYDTGVFLVDFAGDAASATDSINAWASDQTQGLIPELLTSGAVDARSELVLTNAAYLSAPWQDRFDPALTKAAEFELLDGTVVEIPMMSRQYEYPFAIDVDWRALELPFDGADAGMVFVLPNEGEFSEFEASFDATVVERIVEALEASRQDESLVQIRVPRFDFTVSVDLHPALEALGLTTAFDAAAADFTGIDPRGTLYIDGVVHRTTLGVDENGTTAATATGEIIVYKPVTPEITLNRPFLFFIYDHGTGTVLFVGRFMRPGGEPRAPASTPIVQTDIEAICSSLAECTGRTTTVSECQAALATDDATQLEGCADCIRAAAACRWASGYCTPLSGSHCEASTCASYCPSHAF